MSAARKISCSAFLATRVLKMAMLGESLVDARVAPIYKRFSDVQTTILAGAGEIQLHFKSRAPDDGRGAGSRGRSSRRGRGGT